MNEYIPIKLISLELNTNYSTRYLKQALFVLITLFLNKTTEMSSYNTADLNKDVLAANNKN